MGDIVARTIEQYAPGFTDLVETRDVVTPLDIERDYGARGGHPMHAKVALDQWLEWRPLHGLVDIECRSKVCTCARRAPIPVEG